MPELTNLPKDFAGISASPPVGMRVSQSILDPTIVIFRLGGKISARLAGVRKLRGERVITLTPTNEHAWVADCDVIRPLPLDAPSEFARMLTCENDDDVPYSLARELQRTTESTLQVEVTSDINVSGKQLADALPDVLEIPGLIASLYPYQARGVRWMLSTLNSSGGLILADEMGLGKTLQIIALLVLNPPCPEVPALIVCPTSLITNWVREIARFAPSLTVAVHRGPHRTGVYKGLQKTNIVITTYDTVVNDVAIFKAFKWGWIICDEAQAIKNPDSNRRKSIASIPRLRTIPMTGTPVENSLVDLWSLADFAIPGILGTRSSFELEFPDSPESATALGRITDPMILKRRVADVAADLPERIDIDLPLEMEENLANHYREVREETLAKYPVAGALVATLQLQLVCAHPWLRDIKGGIDDGENAIIAELTELPLITAKLERTVELIREAFHSGRKVLVFAIFNRMGDLIKKAGHDLPQAYWGAINGSTPQSDRQTIIDEFSGFEGPACLVLNPKAAGAGLNITAATVVIHISPVWNPALEAQASARAHRRGQTMPVTIYRLFYEDTVERIMLDRSVWKKEMGDEISVVSTRNSDDLKRALEIQPRAK